MQIRIPSWNSLRSTMGLPSPSSATSTPQYQPFGMTRGRSDSFDPASFMRRQAYQYQRGLTDQSYGQRGREAQAMAGQGAAQAGLGGGAALSAGNDALRNVLMARANEQGQLGAQYMGGEAQAAEQEAQRAAAMGLQGLVGQQQMEQLGVKGEQDVLQQIISQLGGWSTEHVGFDQGRQWAAFLEALRRGDPNAMDLFPPGVPQANASEPSSTTPPPMPGFEALGGQGNNGYYDQYGFWHSGEEPRRFESRR